MNSAHDEQQREWEAYRKERDAISAQIDGVAKSADEEHRMGRECAEASQNAYNSGDKEGASMHKSDKEGHYSRRDDFNAEKARLIEIAKSMAPPHSNFYYYKGRYNALMESHRVLQAEYRAVKSQHEAAEDVFSQAQEAFKVARAAFSQAISDERAKWCDTTCQECGSAMRTNVEWSHPPRYCKACREKFAQKQKGKAEREERIARQAGLTRADDYIVEFRPGQGKNNVYFNGYREALGPSHGHAVIDDLGIIHYLRDEHGNVIKDDGVQL